MSEADVPERHRERFHDLVALVIFGENCQSLVPGPASAAYQESAREAAAELNALGDAYPSLAPKVEENPIYRALDVLRGDPESAAMLEGVPEHEWDELAEDVADLYDDGPYWLVDPDEWRGEDD